MYDPWPWLLTHTEIPMCYWVLCVCDTLLFYSNTVEEDDVYKDIFSWKWFDLINKWNICSCFSHLMKSILLILLMCSAKWKLVFVFHLSASLFHTNNKVQWLKITIAIIAQNYCNYSTLLSRKFNALSVSASALFLIFNLQYYSDNIDIEINKV